MDRGEFIKRCQKCAVVSGEKPADCLVKYKEVVYYPMAYTIAFKSDGSPCHIAVLHDLKANSVINARLSEVQTADTEF